MEVLWGQDPVIVAAGALHILLQEVLPLNYMNTSPLLTTHGREGSAIPGFSQGEVNAMVGDTGSLLQILATLMLACLILGSACDPEKPDPELSSEAEFLQLG